MGGTKHPNWEQAQFFFPQVMGVTFGGRSNGEIKKIGCVEKSAYKALLNPNNVKNLFWVVSNTPFLGVGNAQNKK